MFRLLRRVLDRLCQAEKQLESQGLRTSQELLATLEELRNVKSAYTLLSEFWNNQFEAARERVEQEAADHARDFKRTALKHERQEQALQAQKDSHHREFDDLRLHIQALKARLKGGLLERIPSDEFPESAQHSG